ncbi:ceramidase domain-containing protein [Pontivivens insulae]|uniref:Ceramidase n=1 Tax=Pontivivens insulae TaxID=1639689 RepID=A0A2R8A9T4_9RHOB|nr:ceramidase domain-containing protein [Pontivivens insulae]RED12739.1 ceramidase [Pontivivens insulae]SPF28830.1 hypothetical protein POI8812_01133 [Pontivivens insulae]
MNWTDQVDNYCERTDFTYWSEPINAVTNIAFLIAAFVIWQIARRSGRMEPGIAALMLVLTAIGIGSFLFHTHATGWAGALDVLPILFYILIYIYLATTRMLDLPIWAGALAVLLFFPYAAATGAAIGALTGGLNGSEGYAPVVILIAIYGVILRNRKPMTSRGLLIGAGILFVSLTFRTVDELVCSAIPLGTHWLWHGLNGLMLGWMILVMMRHDTDNPRLK